MHTQSLLLLGLFGPSVRSLWPLCSVSLAPLFDTDAYAVSRLLGLSGPSLVTRMHTSLAPLERFFASVSLHRPMRADIAWEELRLVFLRLHTRCTL